MNKSERDALVQQYTQGHAVVIDALAGISEAELDARHDGWTAREVVHHLADSEMTSAIRLRRLLAEDRPVIGGYDEGAFARVLKYAERPIDAALDAFSAARRTTAEILARMTDADWAREGTHSESGRYTAEDWLQIYAAHGHDHAAQIDRTLRLVRGQPVADQARRCHLTSGQGPGGADRRPRLVAWTARARPFRTSSTNCRKSSLSTHT